MSFFSRPRFCNFSSLKVNVTIAYIHLAIICFYPAKIALPELIQLLPACVIVFLILVVKELLSYPIRILATSFLKQKTSRSFKEKVTADQQWQRYRNEAKRCFDNRGIFNIEAKQTHLFWNLERSKRSEHYYKYSLQERRNTNYNQSRICRIEEKTNIISLRPYCIKAKRTDLIKICGGSNKNVLC